MKADLEPGDPPLCQYFLSAEGSSVWQIWYPGNAGRQIWIKISVLAVNLHPAT